MSLAETVIGEYQSPICRIDSSTTENYSQWIKAWGSVGSLIGMYIK